MAIITTDTLKFREYVGDSWKNLLIQANIDFNLIYPVGSIYMSTNNTNPSTLFGGTWERLEDKFLLGAGQTYTAGDTGGEATHTLTDAELPATSGSFRTRRMSWGTGASSSAANVWGPSGKMSITSTGTSGTDSVAYYSGVTRGYETVGFSFGSDTAHNNMPPYLVVYMWKRLTLAPHLPYPQNVLGDIAGVSTAFSIPASGSSVSYNMTGITSDYVLVKWNFSSSPENIPPVDLVCTTYNGYFTITNNGGTTSETIKPLFLKSKEVAITPH